MPVCMVQGRSNEKYVQHSLGILIASCDKVVWVVEHNHQFQIFVDSAVVHRMLIRAFARRLPTSCLSRIQT